MSDATRTPDEYGEMIADRMIERQRIRDAAPDLLEVLEAVAATMLNGGDGVVGDFGWNMTKLNKLRQPIRAAIAKARGEA